MKKEYMKPTARDLSSIPMAVGSCASGTGVPFVCATNGFGATACNATGFSVGVSGPNCNPGTYATACATGLGAA